MLQDKTHVPWLIFLTHSHRLKFMANTKACRVYSQRTWHREEIHGPTLEMH